MKSKKWISLLLLTTSLCSISIFAHADEVKFVNQSKYNLFLGEDNDYSPTRFFNAGDTITIDEKSFKKICKNHPDQCKFYIFRKFGENVATVIFQETTVMSVSNTLNDVSVSGSDSHVIVKNN